MPNRNLLLSLTLLLFAWPGLNAQTTTEKTVKEILSAAAPAVVSIATRDANGNPVTQGSGFVVDASGVIVTNFHLLQGAHTVEVKFRNGEVYDGIGVIDYDVRRDIALIRIRALRLPTLILGDSEKVEQGDRSVAIGNPLGLDGSVSDGLISGLRVFEGTRYLQISAPISPGSSGGPLFDTNGAVIGVITSQVSVEGAQNLNLAVPSQYLEPMLGQTSRDARFTFAQLTQEHAAVTPAPSGQPASTQTEQSVTPQVRPLGEEFTVMHDHGDAFESYCLGILNVSEAGITYKGTDSPHSFEMPLQAVEEAKKNALYGAERDAFHVKLLTGTNYNLIVVNEAGEAVSSDRLLFAIQQALLKAKH